MACDLPTTQESACESGIGKIDSPILLLQIIAQLACDIADAGGGGGGSSQILIYTGSAPAANPPNTALPAIAYKIGAATFYWNTSTLAWE